MKNTKQQRSQKRALYKKTDPRIVFSLAVGGLGLMSLMLSTSHEFVRNAPAAVQLAQLGTTAPGTPTSLDVYDGSTSSRPSSSDKICLKWSVPTNGTETGYVIERSRDMGQTFTEVARVTKSSARTNVTSSQYSNGRRGYCDRGPHTPDVQTHYRVKSYVALAGPVAQGQAPLASYSGYSNQDSAWVSFGNPPAPSNLKVMPMVTERGIMVEFTDNSRNELGYEVHRSTNGRTFSRVATILVQDLGSIRYIDKNVTEGRTYTYKVRTKNSRGFSRFTDPVALTLNFGGTTNSGNTSTPTGGSTGNTTVGSPSNTVPQSLTLNWKLTRSWRAEPRFDLTWKKVDPYVVEVPPAKFIVRRSVSTTATERHLTAQELSSHESILKDLSKTNLTIGTVSSSGYSFRDANIPKQGNASVHYVYMIIGVNAQGAPVKYSNLIDLQRLPNN